MSTLISVRTEPETISALDQIANSLDRNRNWVINEAIRDYLALHAWQVEHVKQGVADSEAGRTLNSKQVKDRLAKLHAKAKR